MSILIGITGGIGSGKSTLINYLVAQNFKVFKSDEEAKKIYQYDDVKKEIIKLFGKTIYQNNKIDKALLSSIVFNNSEKLVKLNSIIHSRLKDVFEAWKLTNHQEVFLFKEAAILFETGSYKDLDYNILITAPKKNRINRVILRDNISKEQVLARMKNQWSDNKKIKLADFVINNVDLDKAKGRLLKILKKLDKSQ